jgi:steroid delta-isomerase-like uncharacterized protein
VRFFFDEIVTKGRVEALDSFAAEDMVDTAAETMGWPAGRAGMVGHVQWLHKGVTDPKVQIQDLIAEDDRVVAYWGMTATHTGDFVVPATGKPFESRAVSRLTFKDGLLTEYHVIADLLGFLTQVGAYPPGE